MCNIGDGTSFPACLQSAVNAPGEVRHEQLERCARLLLDLADEEGANLLQQLPGAVEFIAAALQSGGRTRSVRRSAAVRSWPPPLAPPPPSFPAGAQAAGSWCTAPRACRAVPL